MLYYLLGLKSVDALLRPPSEMHLFWEIVVQERSIDEPFL